MIKRKGSVLSIRQCARRSRLSAYTKRTLGSGNLRKAVALPEGEDLNEWLAANAVDFFNEVSLIYDLCVEDAKRFTIKGAGYPPGVEYRWADPLDKKMMAKPIACSSPKYVAYVMEWAANVMNDPSIFPDDESEPYPDDFRDFFIKHIFRRFFRVLAIVFWNHFKALEKLNAAPHANTTLKHFMFFAFEFKLLDEKETKPLERIVTRLKAEYRAEKPSKKKVSKAKK